VRLHDLSPQQGARKRAQRLGRGDSSNRGATCGRGMRGQKARAGSGPIAGFEGGQMPLYRRVPKLKHFTVIAPTRYTTVNVGALSALETNAEVTRDRLVQAGIVTDKRGPLKILGGGELNVALQVKAAAFSASARRKIEAAGGRCETVA